MNGSIRATDEFDSNNGGARAGSVMKATRIFTPETPLMRATLLPLLLAPLGLLGQTTHFVSVGGSTATPNNLPYYTPQHLTIPVGDIVQWSNQSGTHNVDGRLSTFPGNPAGFYSGASANGSWTFPWTFTIPGVYNYHCSSEGHAATQNGTITVFDPNTGLAELGESRADVRVFPSPALDRLVVEASGTPLRLIRILDLNGAEALPQVSVQQDPVNLDVSALPSGNYFLLLTDAEGGLSAKPFAKQ